MPARTLTVDVVTPDRVVVSQPAVALVAPGVEGSFGVLLNHAPLLTELQPGELRFRSESGQETRMAVSGGFFQAFDNRVTILADAAELAVEIDLDRARRALSAAQAAYTAAGLAGDLAAQREAHAAVERARNRIRVATAP
jgi:F-type H+-transporting ATPase subunit epsilon